MNKNTIKEAFREICSPIIEKEVQKLYREFPNETLPISSTYRIALYASLTNLSTEIDAKIHQLASEVSEIFRHHAIMDLKVEKEALEHEFVARAIVKDEATS